MTIAPPGLADDDFSKRYRVERELGRGGMATVYLARDLKHDRQVALAVSLMRLGLNKGARLTWNYFERGTIDCEPLEGYPPFQALVRREG